MKIVHVTTVHPRYDVRIFKKECLHLAKVYDADLIVADGLGDEICDGINIIDLGQVASRYKRILIQPYTALKKCLELNADIYHLHDPELLLIAKKLVKKGKKVIFDAHEDFPVQILSKDYINPYLAKYISKLAFHYEKHVTKQLHGVVAATPFIKAKYTNIGIKPCVDVNNFPLVDEFSLRQNFSNSDTPSVCYVGGISAIRGVNEIVEAIAPLNVRLNLAGSFESKAMEQKILQNNLVEYFGFLDRKQVASLYNRSICGLVTLHPKQNYLNSLPVKMFEYMAAGLPIIASNFPLWQDIMNKHDCGICVDPLKPVEITKAIKFMLDNPDRARRMGENGRKAIMEFYNWSIEEKKLLHFYDNLIRAC